MSLSVSAGFVCFHAEQQDHVYAIHIHATILLAWSELEIVKDLEDDYV